MIRNDNGPMAILKVSISYSKGVLDSKKLLFMDRIVQFSASKFSTIVRDRMIPSILSFL